MSRQFTRAVNNEQADAAATRANTARMRFHGASRMALGSAVFIAPLVGLSLSACEDSAAGPSGVTAAFDASFDAPSTDAPSTDAPSSLPDGTLGSDAAPDGDAQAFSAKSTCDAPLPIVTYAGNDFATRPVLAAAPGAPIVAAWVRSSTVAIVDNGEAKVFAGGTWGVLATLTTMIRSATLMVAAGGGSAMVGYHQNDDTSMRKRTTGAVFTDVGTPTPAIAVTTETTLRMGPGGHGVQVWRAAGVVGAARIDPTGVFTALPDNAAAGPAAMTSAVIDAAGNGFAVWHDDSTSSVVGRAFQGAAWKGSAAVLAIGGTGGALDAALLPNGDAYVLWSRVDGSPGVHGATLHLDAGSSTSSWSSIDDLMTGSGSSPHRILASASGELTALWGQSDGSGTAKLTARRRPTGGAWASAVTLGKTTELFGAAVDVSGHVTVVAADTAGAAFHYRIAKGATTWSSPVRVDAKSGAGTVGGSATLAVDPATGNPMAAWASGNDIVFTVCR
jgi:hypothetical protein